MTNKLNKGEWSEFYAFIKVLSDRKLNASDSNLNPIKDKYYPVRKILRGDEANKIIYDLQDSQNIHLVLLNGDKNIIKIPYSYISDSVDPLFKSICEGTGAFSIALAEQLIADLNCNEVKASSSSKGDLNIVVHDHITNLENSVEFSIKSYIGNSPTLLNASRATNIIFELDGFEPHLLGVNEIEGSSKLQRRIKYLLSKKVRLNFSNMANENFARNLMKIDSLMPQFLSYYLIAFFGGRASKISELTKIVVDQGEALNGLGNPFNYEDLKYKIKQLLINIALGMVPASNWDGFIKADGGYIVVKHDGEVVCFHIYNISELGEYLFNNTKLDSSSSKRHEYATVYEDGDKFKMKLNLQIRFL